MNQHDHCEDESGIVKILLSDSADEAAARHLKICASCRETAAIVRFLQKSRGAGETSAPRLPTAGFVFWKSRLRRQQRAREKVAQPLRFAQIVAAAVVFAAVVFALIFQPAFFAPLAAALSSTLDVIAQMFFVLAAGSTVFAVVWTAIVFAMRRDIGGK